MSAISQMMSFEDTSAGLQTKSFPNLNSKRMHSPAREGLFFLIDVLAFYALLSLVLAILDFENLKTGLPSQFQHYSITFFWINISVAMALVAGCVMENITFRPARLFGAL